MSDPSWSAILALVRSRVQLRFTLSAEHFADHVIACARSAGAGADPLQHARLLYLDDLYLAQACARRDEDAWNECARRHFGFMLDFARRFLRGADASDVTDRVVAELWEKEKLARYEGRSSLRTWLGAVVVHAALQAGKSVRRRDAAADRDAAEPSTAPAPEETEAARVLAALAAEAIRERRRDEKLLLLLHYEQGLPLDRIAVILNSSKATLSRRLKRLREEVRAAIERMARERYRSSSEDVRSRVDLGRVELDLSALLTALPSVKGTGGDGV